MDQSMCIRTGKRARSSDDRAEHLHTSKRGNSQHVGYSSMFQGGLFQAENLGLSLDYGNTGTNFQRTDPSLLNGGTSVDFSVDTGISDYAVEPILPSTTDHLLWSDPLDLPINGTKQNDTHLNLTSDPDHQEVRDICFGTVNTFVAKF